MILEIILIILLAIYLYNPAIFEFMTNPDCIVECAHVHSENGLNYPWLNDIHGGLKKIQFMEPPNSDVWKDYTDEIWKIHCKVIDHTPDNLVTAHIDAFVNPKTRFAKLLFIFKDGAQIELDEKYALDFYTREADYFKAHSIC